MSTKLMKALLGAATSTIVLAGVADARLVRSGGSSSEGNQCDNYDQFAGGEIGVFNQDGSGSFDIAGFNPADEGEVSGYPPDLGCSPNAFYEFAPGDDLEFEGTFYGLAQRLSASDDLDALITWSIGDFSFTSTTLTPTFEIPPALFRDERYGVSMRIIAAFTPSPGSAFYECETRTCENSVGEALDVASIVFNGGASVFFEPLVDAEVPLAPGFVFMLTGLGGALGWKRVRKD
ncbi:hypothetical protein [Parvularcula maris]|uniref:PEP-CTERM sorting domain-containing protein n=1 Tax=Parvularcula maris TaxID=2965077 RepID=A0A9X2RK65_9PROT|nr:hypothetical protein [Parvularcula maris]MCQ8186631.1 hypothetical protein [Parvularcula maris]